MALPLKKTTKYNYISLPKTLIEAIENLPLTTTQKSHSKKFIGLILKHSFRDYQDIFFLTPMPKNYIVTVFDDKYNSWLNVLLNNDIIHRTDYYSYGELKSECYKYAINPVYFKSQSNKEVQSLTTVSYKDIVKYLDDKNKGIYSGQLENDVRTLKIDYDRLDKIIDDKVREISIENFRINEQITDNTLCFINSQGNKYFIGKDLAIEQAKEKNLDIIQDKSIFRMMPKDEFIATKKVSINLTYKDALNKLRNKAYRAERNTTNRRLDTNFTNMCSLLVDDICEQNDLVQIDLKNSQFTILSMVLSSCLDTDDFKRFKGLCASGKLYERIQKEMSLESRKQAKLLMFELLFSARNNHSNGKKELKKLFPSVVKWIDDFKKENGDDEFSIMLQKEESQIFIDGIYTQLKKKKMFALTKHDSVILKRKDVEKAMKIINSELEKNKLEYTLEIA